MERGREGEQYIYLSIIIPISVQRSEISTYAISSKVRAFSKCKLLNYAAFNAPCTPKLSSSHFNIQSFINLGSLCCLVSVCVCVCVRERRQQKHIA